MGATAFFDLGIDPKGLWRRGSGEVLDHLLEDLPPSAEFHAVAAIPALDRRPPP